MRPALALSLALLTGCSLTSDDDELAFRSLASVRGSPADGPVRVYATAAEAESFLEDRGLSEFVGPVDYETEVLISVTTTGACPTTAYSLRVEQIDIETDNDPPLARFVARVDRDGTGGDEAVYPVAVIAAERRPDIDFAGVPAPGPSVAYTGDFEECALR